MSLYAHTSILLRVDLSPEALEFVKRSASEQGLLPGGYLSKLAKEAIDLTVGLPDDVLVYPAAGGGV